MNQKINDVATIFGKGILGAIPIVGPLAAEIIGSLIPNQRIDRLEKFLIDLESKVSEGNRNKFQENIYFPESLDLIEEGFIQAARSLSNERRQYIASLLKNSLTQDQVKHLEYKRLLSLLSELNDIEILILKSKTLYPGEAEYDTFWQKHNEALNHPMAYMGASQDDIDKYTVFQSHQLHLANLGLLKSRFKKPKRGEFPEFDEKTGMIKSQGYDITPLGWLLLRGIDQVDENQD